MYAEKTTIEKYLLDFVWRFLKMQMEHILTSGFHLIDLANAILFAFHYFLIQLVNTHFN